MAIPDGNEEVRPFVPARDFDKSRAFYRALGFQEDHDKDIAIFRCERAPSSCSVTTRRIGPRIS